MLNRRRFSLCALMILPAVMSSVRAAENLDSSRATASADGAVLWYDFTELGIEGTAIASYFSTKLRRIRSSTSVERLAR